MSVAGQNTVSSEALRSFVERIENVNDERERLADDAKVIFAEAKSQGFIPAAIRSVVKRRKMKPSERQEAEAILDCYMHALGEAIDTPLFRAVGMMSVDIAAREQIIEALKKFVPQSGSITIEAGGNPVRLTRDAAGNVSATDVRPPRETQESKPAATDRKPRPDVPAVDGDGAEALGRKAYGDDEPIIKNPFPFGDARRPRWDKGWRDESGTDGMGK